MSRADVKVGFDCNNRCTFCVQGDKRMEVAPLSTAEIVQRMTDARTRNQGLVLTGGEVTIRKDYFTLLKEAKRLGYHPIQVQSNGRMFADPKFCAASIRAGANEFSPALHGSTPAIHNRLTRAKSFAQTAAGIGHLIRMKQRVLTNSVVTRPNLDDLPNLMRLLHRLGVRHAQLAMVHPLGTAASHFETIVPRLREASTRVVEAVQVGRGLGMTVVVEAMPPCLMPGVEDAVVEANIPFTEIFDGDVHLPDYGAYRQHEGKRKASTCKDCRHNDTCEGPWREYLDHYGDEDLCAVPPSSSKD